jgi:Cu+-exporting ATPase
VRLGEEAQDSKAPTERFIDRFSRYYTPAVLVVGLLVAIVPPLLWAASWPNWIYKGLAVLLIGCPCALVISTPAAIAAALAAGARQGLLMKGGAVLENLGKITAIALDKTGTLTEGRPVVTEIVPHGVPEAELLALAAAAQAGSEHPLARAVIARAEGLARPPLEEFASEPGRGIVARVGGRRVLVGTEALLARHGIAPALAAQAAALEAGGRTVMRVAALDPAPAFLGLIAASDAVKPAAAAAIRRLEAERVVPVLLTGDNRRAAAAVAAALGIARVEAEVLPQDKLRVIERLRGEGRRVAMVGDGVNDAPALAAADVGIAMGTGADVAMHTAGITLMRGDPLLIADALAISRATWRKIRQNLFWAFVYNVIGIPLAAAGLLSPMLAGAAMAFSSVSVVGNALLLRRWHPGRVAR